MPEFAPKTEDLGEHETSRSRRFQNLDILLKARIRRIKKLRVEIEKVWASMD